VGVFFWTQCIYSITCIYILHLTFGRIKSRVVGFREEFQEIAVAGDRTRYSSQSTTLSVAGHTVRYIITQTLPSRTGHWPDMHHLWQYFQIMSTRHQLLCSKWQILSGNSQYIMDTCTPFELLVRHIWQRAGCIGAPSSPKPPVHWTTHVWRHSHWVGLEVGLCHSL